MIYDVQQRTSYRYEVPVATSQHTIRLVPSPRAGLQVFSAHLRIEPEPSERHERADFFGNHIASVAYDLPHDRLDVSMHARVEVIESRPPEPWGTPSWEEITRLALGSSDTGPDSPVHGLFPSRLVPLAAEIRAYAGESFVPRRPMLDAAVELIERIKADFVYQPGATDVTTAPTEAFVLRRGVCQDFAQVLIAGLRGLALPALYVSGFLRTVPPPGRPRLEGADATHAWVSLWCGPEAGWVGLDPTNGTIAGSDHIVLAVGRDYADVAPVDGVIVSAGGHSLQVEVDVVPVDG